MLPTSTICLVIGLSIIPRHSAISIADAYFAPKPVKASVFDMDIQDNYDLPARLITEEVMAAEASNDAPVPKIPQLIENLGLTSLLNFVVMTGLAPSLSDAGPYTVFGPTNDAFINLPDWAKQSASNMTILTNVLKYHILPTKFPSSSLKDELLVDTVLKGRQLRVNIYTNTSATDDVKVVTTQCAPIDLTRTDNAASNGLVHVLNSVMIPPLGNIVETVVACPVFKTLVTAAKAAGIVDTLSGKGPYTLFAPTDTAFKKLPPGTLDKLLKNVTALQNVLEYHVVPLTYCSPGLATQLYGNITTLNKQDIHITISKDGVKVNDANVISPDGSVSNGVVHAIDTVLLPPRLTL